MFELLLRNAAEPLVLDRDAYGVHECDNQSLKHTYGHRIAEERVALGSSARPFECHGANALEARSFVAGESPSPRPYPVPPPSAVKEGGAMWGGSRVRHERRGDVVLNEPVLVLRAERVGQCESDIPPRSGT